MYFPNCSVAYGCSNIETLAKPLEIRCTKVLFLLSLVFSRMLAMQYSEFLDQHHTSTKLGKSQTELLLKVADENDNRRASVLTAKREKL
jgi:hypothetical protein